ncbi:MAG: OadG family protein [Candidatus Limivicinus sp.]|jgi:Na+-transporting methylmalonyl-CoA/oxaloacetate decarboxylase gamma subunit
MTMTFGEAVLYSLLGIIVVFFALLLLMCIIKLMTLFSNDKKSASAAAPAAPAAAAAPAPVPAPGSAGEIKLYDTDERTAAMIMAIVADELGRPVNELRFKSIRELK